MNAEKLKVSLDFGSSPVEVGTLLLQDEVVYFRYSASFLDSQLDISPFKLRKTREILTCPKEPFEGLPGVFNDSIPDGWGRLLLDRKLLEQGMDPNRMGPLDRLFHLGRTAQGALIYEPCEQNKHYDESAIDLDLFADETELLQKTGTAALLDDLYHLGGNSVGARPKILVNYNELSHSFSTIIGSDFEPWIIKFRALTDFRDIAKIEYVYTLMAAACGIEMAPSKLFFSAKGHAFFGTKRFDIQNGKRLHLHSACGLLHDNFRLSTMDYGHVMDAANRLENDLKACEKVFRLAVFNVCSLNMDDHSKNVSFLMNETGKWQFAPAYDLTYSPKQGGYHSLSVANQYKEPGRKELLKLAQHFTIEHAQEIIEEVKEGVSNFDNYTATFDINTSERNLIKKALETKLKQM
jgi:serine/threonine-protein kinase HipA